MGFYGTYLFEGGAWRTNEVGPAIDELGFAIRGDELPDAAEPWILVDIHDRSGTAYLGLTPRTYLDDERASAPTDVACEDLDDADVFVEVKTGRFLAALDLPVPADLQR
jgi:hypothetical protein